LKVFHIIVFAIRLTFQEYFKGDGQQTQILAAWSKKTLRVRFQHSQLCVFLPDPAALGLLFFASALMTSGSERLP